MAVMGGMAWHGRRVWQAWRPYRWCSRHLYRRTVLYLCLLVLSIAAVVRRGMLRAASALHTGVLLVAQGDKTEQVAIMEHQAACRLKLARTRYIDCMWEHVTYRLHACTLVEPRAVHKALELHWVIRLPYLRVRAVATAWMHAGSTQNACTGRHRCHVLAAACLMRKMAPGRRCKCKLGHLHQV